MKICSSADCMGCLDHKICFRASVQKRLQLVSSNQWVRKVTVKELAHRDIFVVSSKD